MVFKRLAERMQAAWERDLGCCHHLLPGGRNTVLGTSVNQKSWGGGGSPRYSLTPRRLARFQKGLLRFLFIL